MPVMLSGEAEFAAWADGTPQEAAGLLRPCDPGAIEAYRVDPKVGNVRNDDASLFEPLDAPPPRLPVAQGSRSEEHTSELQSLMRISYDVFGLKKKNTKHHKVRRERKEQHAK